MANSEFPTHHSEFTAPGWERDENGALRRVKKPHMGRRLPGFDYSQRRIYEITIVLKERRPVLGRLVKKPCGSAGLEDGAGHEPTWVVEPTALGQAALDCWRKITDFWPQVSLIEAQLMPDHFHGERHLAISSAASRWDARWPGGRLPQICGRAGKLRQICGRAERLNGQKDSWIPFFSTRASLRK